MKTHTSKTMFHDVAVVRVMKMGYPSFNRDSEATGFMNHYLTDSEIVQNVRDEFGYAAKIYSITRPFIGPIQPTPKYCESYIRQMSQGG